MKKFMISSVAAIAFFALAGTASAVNASEIYSSSTGYLKVGSGYGTKAYQNANVKAAQTALNACVAGSNLELDGKFGPLTKGVFMSFQTSKGIKADGIIGPVTAAQLAACSGSTVADNGSSTVITGTGEGYLSNDVKLGAYNSTKVMEGDKDKVVYGFEVLAKDADQKIDGLSIALQNTGTGSVKITRYASDISVWLDGKEIGRKSISNWSSDTSDVYTYRFTGMNGVVKKDMKGQILIAVSGTPTMDSTDAANEAWKIDVGTSINTTSPYTGSANFVSAVSPNGRYRDYGAAQVYSTIDFQKAGGVSSDQKFKVTTSATNPVAQTVQVSNTSDTLDKVLLAFDAKAENAGMIVQKIPVVLTSTNGGADAVAPNPEAIVKTVKLYANGTPLATESVPAGAGAQTVIFGNISKLNYAIAANATAKFEVRADFNDIENTGIVSTDFDNGDKIAAAVNSSTMTVELDNVNRDTVANVSGSSTGENMTLLATGALVSMGTVTTSYSPETYSSAANQKATYNIPVTIKAFDDTLYVGQSIVAAAAGAISGTNALSFTFNNSSAPATQVTTIGGATIVPTITSSAPANQAGTSWRIDSGSTQTFNVKIEVTGASAVASFRVQMQDLQFFSDAGLTTGATVQNLTPMSGFQTAYTSVK